MTFTPQSRSKPRVICAYCRVQNPADQKNCLACGAPLNEALPMIEPLTTFKKTQKTPNIITTQKHLGKARKVGVEVEKAADTALYAYSMFWRTLAEAGVIAICGFALGLVGGAVGVPALGPAEAVLLGMGGGFSIIYSLLIWLMTPGGFVLGAAMGIALWALGAGMPVFAITTGLCSIGASLIGAYRIPFRIRNLYEKLRPILGGLGGLLFGLWGMGVGVGLRAAVNALLTAIS